MLKQLKIAFIEGLQKSVKSYNQVDFKYNKLL